MDAFLVQQPSGGGGNPPANQALRFASPTNAYPQGTITSGGTKTTLRTRSPAVLGSGDASSLAVGFPAAVITSSTVAALGNDLPIVKAAIGLDGETVGYPITFSASRSATVTNGAYIFTSDEFTPSLFASLSGATKFTRGQKFWIQWDYNVVSGQKFPSASVAYASAVGGALSLTLDPATFDGSFAVDNFSTRTTGTATFWTNQPNICGAFLLARFAAGDPPVIVGFGDSLTFGQNDTTSNILTSGSFQRALMNANGDSLPIGGMKCALSGSTGQWLASTGGQGLMAAIGPLATHMYLGFGANYWLASPGTTLSAVQTSINSIIASWYASDSKKRVRSILARKVTPRINYGHTTSSATNVTTTATLTSVDGAVPVNGSTVTNTGFTPAAYNGTFTVTSVTGSTFTITLLSDPGGSATVQGTWNDGGVNSSSTTYLNNCWGPEGTAPLGNARYYNDWLDTIIADNALLGVLNLTTNRASSNQTLDGFYQIAGTNPSLLSVDGTHWVAATGWQNEKNDMQPTFQGLV